MQFEKRRKNDNIIQTLCSRHYKEPDVVIRDSLRLYDEMLSYIKEGYTIKAVKESITTFSMKNLNM